MVRVSELDDAPRRSLDVTSFDWFASALAKRPEDRFASAAALADTLANALANALPANERRRADALLRKQPWEAA